MGIAQEARWLELGHGAGLDGIWLRIRVFPPPGCAAAHALDDSPAFRPLQPWLRPEPSALGELNAWAEAAACPVRFAAPDADGRYYERRIAESGTVPTRPGHWHDTYNALIWLRFPRIKAALNARHVRAMETMAVAGRRGPERDFLTLVDESGAIVCCPAPDLLELWRAHRWRELFVDRRERLEREFRVILFGHSLYEQLHAPFPALTARALVLDGAEALGMGDAELDAHLAARLAAGDWPVLKAASLPLPLLGVPGWWPANEAPAFYDDAEVFRPRPSPGPRSRGRRA